MLFIKVYNWPKNQQNTFRRSVEEIIRNNLSVWNRERTAMECKEDVVVYFCDCQTAESIQKKIVVLVEATGNFTTRIGTEDEKRIFNKILEIAKKQLGNRELKIIADIHKGKWEGSEILC